jgi:ATP-dependent DNA helicase RecQ
LQNYNQTHNTEILKLKPLQEKALDVLLSGKDCLCSLPTGYGKSLIFELLPFIDPNCLVVIIEPLNVIMAQEAQKLGTKSMCLTSKSDLTGIKKGSVKYIFCHPEDILYNKKIMEMFRNEDFKMKQIFLVVDEAHCILEWGDDFRPDFKRLGNLRSVFCCQVLALTATVTCVGQKEIMKNLLMKNWATVCAAPTKPNIVLAVLKRPSATSKGNTSTSPYDFIFEKILNELKNKGKDFPLTIVYCKSIQWIGYGYELAREILGDQFYEGEQQPEHARVVMFHSSMADSKGKVSISSSHIQKIITML